MHDDDLLDVPDVYRCTGCELELNVLPPGAAPPMPFHVVHEGPELGLQLCGYFEYMGKAEGAAL
jgi:hypothetical protein